MLGGLGGAGEAGVQHLAQVAADMRATSEQLAARQAEAVCVVSQELFCSPEIFLQGAMELWHTHALNSPNNLLLLLPLLVAAAADMRATSEQLVARQAEAVSCAVQELFCSPEIIRQGSMEL
uniref:Uncharacterized protein n=1 Tax=Tetradesmus obliquus TaxID=3088 RepID=A0A383VCY2_TETOB